MARGWQRPWVFAIGLVVLAVLVNGDTSVELLSEDETAQDVQESRGKASVSEADMAVDGWPWGRGSSSTGGTGNQMKSAVFNVMNMVGTQMGGSGAFGEEEDLGEMSHEDAVDALAVMVGLGRRGGAGPTPNEKRREAAKKPTPSAKPTPAAKPAPSAGVAAAEPAPTPAPPPRKAKGKKANPLSTDASLARKVWMDAARSCQLKEHQVYGCFMSVNRLMAIHKASFSSVALAAYKKLKARRCKCSEELASGLPNELGDVGHDAKGNCDFSICVKSPIQVKTSCNCLPWCAHFDMTPQEKKTIKFPRKEACEYKKCKDCSGCASDAGQGQSQTRLGESGQPGVKKTVRKASKGKKERNRPKTRQRPNSGRSGYQGNEETNKKTNRQSRSSGRKDQGYVGIEDEWRRQGGYEGAYYLCEQPYQGGPSRNDEDQDHLSNPDRQGLDLLEV